VDLDPASVFGNSPVGQFGLAYTAADSSLVAAIVPHLTAWSGDDGKLPVPVNATGEEPCLAGWLLQVADSRACWVATPGDESPHEVPVRGSFSGRPATPGGYAAAVELGGWNVSAYVVEYVILPNSSNVLALPALVSLINNAIVANLTGSSTRLLRPSFHQMPPEPQSQEDKDQTDMFISQIKSMMIIIFIMSLAYVFASIARDVVEGRKKSHKQLQVLMGVTIHQYWLARFIWDLLYYYVLVTPPLAIAAAVEIPLVNGASIVVLLAFPLAMLPFTYLVTMTSSEPDAVQNLFQSVFLVSFVLAFGLYFVLAIPFIASSIDLGPAGIGENTLFIHYLYCMQHLRVLCASSIRPPSTLSPSSIYALYIIYSSIHPLLSCILPPSPCILYSWYVSSLHSLFIDPSCSIHALFIVCSSSIHRLFIVYSSSTHE
jgi:hypothetical protein